MARSNRPARLAKREVANFTGWEPGSARWAGRRHEPVEAGVAAEAGVFRLGTDTAVGCDLLLEGTRDHEAPDVRGAVRRWKRGSVLSGANTGMIRARPRAAGTSVTHFSMAVSAASRSPRIMLARAVSSKA